MNSDAIRKKSDIYQGGIMTKIETCEEFRDRVLRKTAERISPALGHIMEYSGMQRYNPGKWAMRGCGAAEYLIERTPPLPEEIVEQYGKRLLGKLEALKKEYYDDPDDEDGFAAGAIADYIRTVEALLK